MTTSTGDASAAGADDDAAESGESGLGSDASFLRAVAQASERPPPIAMHLEGTRIGKYLVGKKLGSGGMGVVHLAEDETLKRTVALKVMREREGVGSEHRRRFMREARTASAVRHPNIASVYEVGSDGDRTFLAMELVPGQSLRARLAAEPLALAEAVRIAREIASALEAAHAAGVVHRDLKPDNVMIEPDDRVKVLDFGLARWIPPEGSGAAQSEALTIEGNILGTPGYMSPEQARGLSADARSDVFALGVVLFEMLTGTRPFVGETKMDVLMMTSRDQAPSVLERRRDAPRALARLIASMLEKDPAARPSTAAAIVDELDRLSSARMRGDLRKHALLAVVVAVLAAVAIAFAISPGEPEAAPPADLARAETPPISAPSRSAEIPVEVAPATAEPAPAASAVAPPAAPAPTASASAPSRTTPRARPAKPSSTARPKPDPLADQK